MSGIAGIIHFDGKPVEPGLIEKMTGAMAYRGPDGINHWVKGSVALGQCMLRTTPESLEEHQPLTNEDESLVFVMDGRVDNREELRSAIQGRGAVLRDCSDAELVLRAYEIWGQQCMTHIDGDFAVVVWDARRRWAFCARDRMGKQPFYYLHVGCVFAFASDFHTLLGLPDCSRVVNEGMLAEHLAVSITNLTETLIEGVNRLPPACFQIVGPEGRQEERYWDLDCTAEIRYRRESDYQDHFLELFRRTVKAKMRSIGPVGVYLSGGVDSSAVACVAAELDSRIGAVDTFSLLYPGKPCDERPFIEKVNHRSSRRSTTTADFGATWSTTPRSLSPTTRSRFGNSWIFAMVRMGLLRRLCAVWRRHKGSVSSWTE